MTEFAVVGKGLPRVDALDKVTGHAQYVEDLKLPNMLYVKVKRSVLPHAKLININSTKAENLIGVKAVVTSKDMLNNRFGRWVKDETVFPTDKVRFVGEPIAAVAAIDEDTAEEALELIEADYEELPAIFDPLEAMREDSPPIHENLKDYVATFDVIKYGNICSHTIVKKGDINKAFGKADFIFEDIFKTQVQHQCPLEPQAVLADIDASGKVTIWASTSAPFWARLQLAEAMMVPMSSIRIRTVHVGGHFGEKETYIPIDICFLLTRKTRRPVRLVLTREEGFTAVNPRHPSIINLKTAVTKEGLLIARNAQIVMDAGAYATDSPGVLPYTNLFSTGPYNIPNVMADGYCVYTNKQPFGAMRGFGHPQIYFAVESQMDIIADKMGIDTVEIRMKNCFDRDGSELCTGQRVYHCGLKKTLKRASSLMVREKVTGGDNKRFRRGRGIACSLKSCGLLGSGAIILLNDDGTLRLLTGATDVGQGSSTVLRQIAAEELAVSTEDISIVSGDTDTTPFDFGTLASRVVRASGSAVRLAAADLRKQLFALAAERLKVKTADLELCNRRIRVKKSPDKTISLAELSLSGLFLKGGPIIGRGSFLEKSNPIVAEYVKGYPYMNGDPAFEPVTNILEVEVDTETGHVRVLRATTCQDVGRCINPITTQGQIEGAVVQGIGYALTEETLYKNGVILNPNFSDYKIPTALDIPEIVPIIVEEPDSTGPYGAKGVGEGAITPVAPAIANAIYDAIGIRIRNIPITAENILNELKERGSI
jgi:carbon-monoxide dehydrogenase large subunit